MIETEKKNHLPKAEAIEILAVSVLLATGCGDMKAKRGDGAETNRVPIAASRINTASVITLPAEEIARFPALNGVQEEVVRFYNWYDSARASGGSPSQELVSSNVIHSANVMAAKLGVAASTNLTTLQQTIASACQSNGWFGFVGLMDIPTVPGSTNLMTAPVIQFHKQVAIENIMYSNLKFPFVDVKGTNAVQVIICGPVMLGREAVNLDNHPNQILGTPHAGSVILFDANVRARLDPTRYSSGMNFIPGRNYESAKLSIIANEIGHLVFSSLVDGIEGEFGNQKLPSGLPVTILMVNETYSDLCSLLNSDDKVFGLVAYASGYHTPPAQYSLSMSATTQVLKTFLPQHKKELQQWVNPDGSISAKDLLTALQNQELREQLRVALVSHIQDVVLPPYIKALMKFKERRQTIAKPPKV